MCKCACIERKKKGEGEGELVCACVCVLAFQNMRLMRACVCSTCVSVRACVHDFTAAHGFQGSSIGAIKARHWIRRVRERNVFRHGNVPAAGLQDGRQSVQNHLFQVLIAPVRCDTARRTGGEGGGEAGRLDRGSGQIVLVRRRRAY